MGASKRGDRHRGYHACTKPPGWEMGCFSPGLPQPYRTKQLLCAWETEPRRHRYWPRGAIGLASCARSTAPHWLSAPEPPWPTAHLLAWHPSA